MLHLYMRVLWTAIDHLKIVESLDYLKINERKLVIFLFKKASITVIAFCRAKKKTKKSVLYISYKFEEKNKICIYMTTVV